MKPAALLTLVKNREIAVRKPRTKTMPPRFYQARVLGEMKSIRGFNEQGELCLASAARYTFRPLKEDAIIPSSRLAAVASLRQSSLGWMVDDQSLDKSESSIRGKDSRTWSPEDHRLIDLFLFLNDRDTEPAPKDIVRIEAVAWFEGREFADGSGEPLLLVSFRAVAPSRSSAKGQGKCGVCGWIHDDGFTEIHGLRKRPIKLRGILPKIVAAVHKAHEQGATGLEMKSDAMKDAREGYAHPSKAFNDLNCAGAYKLIFNTSRRGRIALRLKE